MATIRVNDNMAQALYLSWVNEYISLNAFAFDKGFITLEGAEEAINRGRIVHEASVAAIRLADTGTVLRGVV